jgi:hypothetical protein
VSCDRLGQKTYRDGIHMILVVLKMHGTMACDGGTQQHQVNKGWRVDECM